MVAAPPLGLAAAGPTPLYWADMSFLLGYSEVGKRAENIVHSFVELDVQDDELKAASFEELEVIVILVNAVIPTVIGSTEEARFPEELVIECRCGLRIRCTLRLLIMVTQ